MNRVPNIATGRVVPGGVKSLEQQIYEAKKREKEKQQYRHDWKIAIFSAISGGIMGLITSFIFWLCTK